ncbi:putative rhamnogalacturonate lyase [Rosellinia necatrix]|uniref:rhamnogalacturonan endolyase n=1 Tax=Rosellinia necatrix TaxID=77044 RepID=A0A1W2TS40_ROSNE|nr:putative rhamnogalacturonate lyase [Rosellinia necatrix]
MKAILLPIVAALAGAVPTRPHAISPFLNQVDNQTWVIGNGLWNLTQGPKYGVKLFYKDRDCVGDAVGHYVSYNGAASDLSWTSASIVDRGSHGGEDFIDIMFEASEGEMHWVIFSGLAGAYQYFVNRALPVLGEFRTLWRLDNTTFPRGKTNLRDEELPPLSDYIAANKVQDETWLRPDGNGYITKYDFTDWVRTQTYYGVYGDSFGSWYINPGKDYYNGNHLKQELMVHRESATGDAVQLNMIHGTHFMASASDAFPDGKMWGPWLWYLNDGSQGDAAARARRESSGWPYAWLRDDAYQARGSVAGRLVLSDGRPAAHAAVFLGDDGPGNKTALDMGSDYYYTAHADAEGRFAFAHVRAARYGLQAWSNGSAATADVTTTFLRDGVVVAASRETDLGRLEWDTSSSSSSEGKKKKKKKKKTRIFQVGDFDRTSYGFRYGGAPNEHALVDRCPADLVYRVGESETADWCFGQTHLGNWTIAFDVTPGAVEAAAAAGDGNATLIVSLAGYSSSASSVIWANGWPIGNLTSGAPGLLNDPSLYRSATAAGEWRYFEFAFDAAAAALREGPNEITFQMTRSTTWHGFMWDSIVLEW